MPAKPKLGQNFLHDAGAIRRIVAALGDIADETVVEIGSGNGAITGVLAHRAARLIAIELDRELAVRLRAVVDSERVSILEQDVLQFDFAAAAKAAGRKLVVAGNLPYYITSPILLHLAQSHAALNRAVLMVQREVAERVAAVPGSRDYGLLTVTAQMYGTVESLFTLPPGRFRRRRRCTPPSSAGGSRRALPRSTLASTSSWRLRERHLPRNAKPWPTTCARLDTRQPRSAMRWPQLQSSHSPAPKRFRWKPWQAFFTVYRISRKAEGPLNERPFGLNADLAPLRQNRSAGMPCSRNRYRSRTVSGPDVMVVFRWISG